MTNARKTRRQVDRLVERHFWEGFFSYLNDGPASHGLEYTHAPRWWTRVACIAYQEGHAHAKQVVEKVGTRRIGYAPMKGTGIRAIPGRVYAECYGEARCGVVT